MPENLTFETRGNVELLSQTRLALFASRAAPEQVYEAAKQVFSRLAALPLSLAGGWQAPLEKHLLHLFPRKATANIIHYLARDINTIRLNAQQEEMLAESRLLLISPSLKQARTTSALVKKRDALIFLQTKKILFLHIRHGGRLEQQFNELYASGHDLYILDHPANEEFLLPEAVALRADNCDLLLQ
jgi:hypothetical protein